MPTDRARPRRWPGRARRASTSLLAIALISVVGATGTGPAAGQRAPATIDLVPAVDRLSPRTAADAAALRPSADAAPRRLADVPTLPRSVPVGLRIPSVAVESELTALGLADDGTLEVPAEGFPAGWYRGAPTPGELGPAVIVGHVDWAGSPGVFADLHLLQPGDRIEVAREDGSTATFRVTTVDRFPKETFPTDAVYGDLDHAGLRLITCGGDFDGDLHSYVENVVVFAELVTP